MISTLAFTALAALVVIWIALKVIRIAFKVAVVCVILILGGGIAAGDKIDLSAISTSNLSPVAWLQKLI
jgi:hypothetical protein